ncbi:transposase [Nonomuraea angiospora]|uniref:transposase n=1 Tax=Nonomuraea angiospora TaxID=46172 RepID=UPI003787E893
MSSSRASDSGICRSSSMTRCAGSASSASEGTTPPRWRNRYKIRAGVEGTISQAARNGIRRTRYLGLNKTNVANALSAAAINLIRLDAWLTETPLGATRVSQFTRLDLALTA